MDIVCYSHLRWDFVFQRPQHLLSRFAKRFRVFYVEEPVYGSKTDTLGVYLSKESVWVVTPHIKHEPEACDTLQKKILIERLFEDFHIDNYINWFLTPMALPYAKTGAALTIYDCMDELSAFKFAPPELCQYEQELFQKADIVFTGGYSLYEAKKHLHSNIHPFPSSIDKEHFAKARKPLKEPSDQLEIPYPRIGFLVYLMSG